MADEVKTDLKVVLKKTDLDEVEKKLLFWVKKHDKVMSENYKLKDKIKRYKSQLIIIKETLEIYSH